MAEDKRKVQIELGVNADTSGLDQMAQAAQGMAEAVQQAGAQAGQGLEAISASAAPAAEKLDAATTRMAQSIQRATAAMQAGAKGSADFYQALAISRGIDTKPLEGYIGELRRVEQAQRAAQQATAAASKADAFIASLKTQAEAASHTRSELLALQAAELGLTQQASQYIQQLRALEQGQTNVGMSAKATANAMRTIPAQLQDIAVSLQGGMNPITVLSQQGSQLATVFGGVGPALRGVATYLVGLVNPFTVAAAAVIGLTVAFVQGSKELDAYQRALILTGNAAGTTASQLADMARVLGQGNFTQSQAASALADIVKSGAVGAEQLQRFTQVALEFERATGQAVSKTADQFKALRDAPLEASVKLNSEINHLTTTVYEHIRALEQQGRTTEAARAAQDAYANAIAGQSAKIVENNGVLVTSWNAVLHAASAAWNAMLGIGRDVTGSEQLAGLRQQLSLREQRGPLRPQDPASVAAFEAGNKALRDQIALLDRLNQQQDQQAKKQAQGNVALEQRTKWDKEGVEFLNNRAKREEALRKAEVEGQALIKAGLITQTDLTNRLNAIREKFKDPAVPKIGRDAFQTEALREYASALDAFSKIASSAAAKAENLSKTQEELRKVQASPVWAAYSRQQQEQIIFAASLAQAEEDRAEATKKDAQAHAEFARELAASDQATAKHTATLEEAAATAERGLAQYGLLKSQIQVLTLARLEDMRAAAAAGGEDLEQIDRRIAAQKRLIEATRGTEVRDAQKKAAEETEREWKRTAESIEESLTDALLRGFESGKDFATNFRDTVKNMFATMVLRPVISAALSPVSGALAGISQGLGGSVVGGGGSALGGLGSLAGGIGSMFGAGGLGGSLAAGAGWLGGASTLTGSLSAAGSLIGTGTGAGILSGLGMAAGALGPLALGALAAYAIFGGKGGGPKTESGFGAGVPLRGDPSSSKAVAQAIAAQYKAIAGDFAQELQVGVFSATDPQGTAMTQLAVNAQLAGQSIYDRGARLGGIENVGRSQEELAAAVTEETERVVLQALQASNLPDKIGDYVRSLGDIGALGGDVLDAAVQRLQTAMAQRQTLEAQRFALEHTALEQITATREKERAALDETNRALYDHVAALTDLRTQETAARDALTSAYQTESDALRGVIERHQGYAQQLRDVRDSLSLRTDSPLTASQRDALARSRFEGTLTSATAGNDAAFQALGGSATDFLEAARNAARSPVEVAAAFAKVQADLTTAAASADSQATIAQQQLDAMTEQLTALGLVNTSVLSVKDALTAYLDTQAAIQQETLRYAALLAGATPPGFAGGGLASGIARVGERGTETVDFETPGRVYTAEQTQGMFASNAALEPLLRDLNSKLDVLIDSTRTGDVAMVASLSKVESRLRKFDVDGMPPVRVDTV